MSSSKRSFEYICDEDSFTKRAILVGIDRGSHAFSIDESLAELKRLADTAGATTVGFTSQRLLNPNPSTFVGKGKVQEIAQLVNINNADLVIFDDELSPSQQVNLEKALPGVKIIDRTALVLDIFSLHALTREGTLQVRLAKNQYLYPRLRGMWAHLASNRMGGGVGSRFGEGESQLEVDRRIVRKRIDSIKKDLLKLEKTRDLQRKKRLESSLFKVSLVGYTNSGKSTLLNKLTDSSVLATDKLFATLDSTTRKLFLSKGREITVTDTVGFIQKLPTTLVEAFKSTLDEITESSLILLVLDASSLRMNSQLECVLETLQQIGAESIPIVKVLNKIDLLDESAQLALASRFPNSCQISAQEGTGIDNLLDRISLICSSADALLCLNIPFDRGDLVSLAHSQCSVISEHYSHSGTQIQIKCPKQLEMYFEDYIMPAD